MAEGLHVQGRLDVREGFIDGSFEVIAPHRSNRRNKTQDCRRLQRRRWKIERLFAWLQNFRRVSSVTNDTPRTFWNATPWLLPDPIEEFVIWVLFS